MNRAMLKERRTHGTPLYPVSIYSIACVPEEPLLYLHWHEEFEFLLLTKGRAVFRVDRIDYEVKAGEAIFVNSGLLHSGYALDCEPCSFMATVFHPKIFTSGTVDIIQEKYIQPLIRMQYSVPVHITPDTAPAADLLSMLREIHKMNGDSSSAHELATKGLLYLMMNRLFLLGKPTGSERRSTAEQKMERFKKVAEYIHTHFREPIRLRDLAGIASMSEGHVCRFFKEITSKSPIEYLNQYRLQQAATLLKETNRKIMDIALDVGFNNLSYFIGLFKRCYGLTPSQYRKRTISASSSPYIHF
ncbi:Transcriptional regulator, AraC family [[Clostridium] ultunense Esp]|nr:Transcriptional regulator, AraC family [[Clostridium] ultunense Esp]